MITLRQIISDIRNIATSGSNPTNFAMEDSQIAFWINETRSMLISQSIQKRNDMNDAWLQQITCMDLIEADKSECCEITTNCKILRTTLKIPATVDSVFDNSIVRVETNNGTIISKTTAFESKYNNYSKFSSNKPKWYYKNDYLYIINEEFVDQINVTGVFESPEDLAAFTSCNGSTCFSYDDSYPLTMKMASQITDLVLKTKVLVFYQMPKDTSNNSDTDSDRQTK